MEALLEEVNFSSVYRVGSDQVGYLFLNMLNAISNLNSLILHDYNFAIRGSEPI